MGLKRIFFRTAAALQLEHLLRALKPHGSVTILCLHRISDQSDFFWQPVYPETFEQLLAYCRRHYDVIPLSRAHTPQKGKKPRLVLSFDDGYGDFMDAALPLLRKYDCPANHNVVINCLETGSKIWTQEVNDLFNAFRAANVSGPLFDHKDEVGTLRGKATDWLAAYHAVMQRLLSTPMAERLQTIGAWKDHYRVSTGNYRMMNWQDVDSARQAGVEIGSHTVSHDSLPTLNSEQIWHELAVSKEKIETQSGTGCDVLALPNGQYNEAVLAAAKDAGYHKVLLLNERLYMPVANTSNLIVNRINMVQEDAASMKLRAELFHRPGNLFKPR